MQVQTPLPNMAMQITTQRTQVSDGDEQSEEDFGRLIARLTRQDEGNPRAPQPDREDGRQDPSAQTDGDLVTITERTAPGIAEDVKNIPAMLPFQDAPLGQTASIELRRDLALSGPSSNQKFKQEAPSAARNPAAAFRAPESPLKTEDQAEPRAALAQVLPVTGLGQQLSSAASIPQLTSQDTDIEGHDSNGLPFMNASDSPGFSTLIAPPVPPRPERGEGSITAAFRLQSEDVLRSSVPNLTFGRPSNPVSASIDSLVPGLPVSPTFVPSGPPLDRPLADTTSAPEISPFAIISAKDAVLVPKSQAQTGALSEAARKSVVQSISHSQLKYEAELRTDPAQRALQAQNAGDASVAREFSHQRIGSAPPLVSIQTKSFPAAVVTPSILDKTPALSLPLTAQIVSTSVTPVVRPASPAFPAAVGGLPIISQATRAVQDDTLGRSAATNQRTDQARDRSIPPLPVMAGASGAPTMTDVHIQTDSNEPVPSAPTPSGLTASAASDATRAPIKPEHPIQIDKNGLVLRMPTPPIPVASALADVNRDPIKTERQLQTHNGAFAPRVQPSPGIFSSVPSDVHRVQIKSEPHLPADGDRSAQRMPGPPNMMPAATPEPLVDSTARSMQIAKPQPSEGDRMLHAAEPGVEALLTSGTKTNADSANTVTSAKADPASNLSTSTIYAPSPSAGAASGTALPANTSDVSTTTQKPGAAPVTPPSDVPRTPSPKAAGAPARDAPMAERGTGDRGVFIANTVSMPAAPSLPVTSAAAAAPPPGTLLAPPPAQQVAHAVASAIRQGKTGQIDLILRPQELGQVRFEMTTVADRIHVIVSAERPDSLDLIRRSAEQLVADLRQSGFGEATLGFGSWTQRDQSPNPVAAREGADSNEDSSRTVASQNKSTPSFRPAADGRLDLRL